MKNNAFGQSKTKDWMDAKPVIYVCVSQNMKLYSKYLTRFLIRDSCNDYIYTDQDRSREKAISLGNLD